MTRPDRAIRRSVGRIVDTFCERLRKRTTPDFIAAFGRRLPRSQKASLLPSKPVAVVAKHARVERSTVYRRIERYLAERAPCSLADGKRSGRSRMTPALTHAVQQILAWVPVAAHLATYLGLTF
jgi:hypothetical protein